ncbi:MAG: nitroreductase [Streptosporangiales bacterium]|nr:nitroreductase [Streptosporangiales bacterium]
MTHDEEIRGPWSVDLADFPPDAGTHEVLAFAARFGLLAPSPHNTQPWLFHLHDAHLDVIGDTSRGLAVSDPYDRELVISCGSVITNITLALSRLGYRSDVVVMPDPRDPELYARIGLAGSAEPSSDDVELFEQITRRRTSRVAFDERRLPDELVTRLARDVMDAGATLHVVDDRRPTVCDLITEADRLQMADPHFRRELAAWLAGRGDRADGIPEFSVEIGHLRLPPFVTPLVVRTFDIGDGKAAYDTELVEHSGLLAVIATPRDDVTSRLSAGRALQKVLLRACAHDVRSSFLNQPIEIDSLRGRLATAVGAANPQLVLRLGYGPSPSPSRRRDPAEFFVS